MKTYKITVLVLMLIIFICPFIVHAQNNEEREALEKFYDNTTLSDSSWFNDTNWLDKNSDICDWYGVVCDAQKLHVRELNLSNNNLDNSYSDGRYVKDVFKQLENLKELRDINLDNNQMKGDILEGLISINTVEHINLSYNALTGKIPPKLLTHNSLKYLYLNNNQLTGNIPYIQKSYYDDDSKILAINLAHNKLTGSIPQSIDRLINIETLCLNNNMLSGYIPESIGKLLNLHALYLNGNLLTGSIPEKFLNLKNLNEYIFGKKIQGLDLRWNALYLSDQSSYELEEFLNEVQIDSYWLETQTICPKSFTAIAYSISSVTLGYSAVAFQDYTGGYEIYYDLTSYSNESLTDTIPYSYSIVTSDKSIEKITINNLKRDRKYYFRIRTITYSHINNSNIVKSEFSEEIDETPRNYPPEQPTAINSQKKYDQSQITLQTSPYIDPENDKHLLSYWEIWKSDKKSIYYSSNRISVCSGYLTTPEYINYSVCYQTDIDLTEITVNLEEGMKYKWRVGYKDSGSGKISYSREYSFTVGKTITDDSDELKIKPGIKISDYKMYSYHMWLAKSDAKNFFNEIQDINDYAQNYHIATYDPEMCDKNGSDCYVEYGEGLSLEPGRAYWIVARNGISLTVTGIRVAMKEFDISLKYNETDGRNMISCPNYADYDWGKIEVWKYFKDKQMEFIGLISNNDAIENYIDNRLFEWNGRGYLVIVDEPGVYEMKKYKGYWVNAKQKDVVLRFTPDAINPDNTYKSQLLSKHLKYQTIDVNNNYSFDIPQPPHVKHFTYNYNTFKHYNKQDSCKNKSSKSNISTHQKSIHFINIPPYGNRIQNVSGIVNNVNNDNFNIIVYIFQQTWKIKPNTTKPYTIINPDNTWTCDITTSMGDHKATKIAAFLISKGYKPSLINNKFNLPHEIFENAVDYIEIKRSNIK